MRTSCDHRIGAMPQTCASHLRPGCARSASRPTLYHKVVCLTQYACSITYSLRIFIKILSSNWKPNFYRVRLMWCLQPEKSFTLIHEHVLARASFATSPIIQHKAACIFRRTYIFSLWNLQISHQFLKSFCSELHQEKFLEEFGDSTPMQLSMDGNKVATERNYVMRINI